MKKLLSILCGVFLVLGMSVPAMATVLVWGTVSLDKDITVTENVTIEKVVRIRAIVDDTLEAAAEADSLLNQDNVGNSVVGLQDVDDNYRTAVIDGSINTNTGIVGVNQDAGNMNNQANVVSIAAVVNDTDPDDFSALAHAQADAGQINILNSVSSFEDWTKGPQKADLINNSIIGNTGIVGVNQSVGNMNNQANQVVIAVAENALIALADVALGQINAGNVVMDFGTVRTDVIAGSINGNTGIVGVNQSAGNMNNQINTVNIAATLH
jgi:hypothetical protein